MNPLWTVTEMDDTHMVNLNDPQGTAKALMSLLYSAPRTNSEFRANQRNGRTSRLPVRPRQERLGVRPGSHSLARCAAVRLSGRTRVQHRWFP